MKHWPIITLFAISFLPIASTTEEPGVFSCFEELSIPPYSTLARNGLEGSATVTFQASGNVTKASITTAFPNLRAELEKYVTASRIREGYCRVPVSVVFDFVQRGEMSNTPVTTVKLLYPNRVVISTEPLRGVVQEYDLKLKAKPPGL